jgi:hypothetical protein
VSGQVFYWVGLATVIALAVASAGFALLFLYAKLIYRRFQLIPFRRGKRRLSLASWHSSRLTTAIHYDADDFPIGLRPFYLSYRVGQTRYFIMLGTHGPSRFSPIQGKHPEDAA